MSAHDHKHHASKPAPVPLLPEDVGSRALSDALRSSFVVVKLLMGLLVVGFFLSGMFTVSPQERAVVLRFGKPLGQGDKMLLGPGFHWAFPAPIDEIVKIPYAEVQVANSTVGWYMTSPEHEAARSEPPPRPTLNPATDGYVLTGDANIIHVRAALRYRIVDPLQFIFAFRDAPDFTTNALNNALFYAAAQMSVDDALTRNVTGFNERVAARVTELADKQKLGISVENVALTGVIPPRQLADNFRAVLDASVRRDTVLNEARSETNAVLSRAVGEAAMRRAVAQSDRTRLVEAVQSEAESFTKVLPEYRRNPELFVRLRQGEVVQRVLTNANERIFLASRLDGKSRALRIDLSREPAKLRPAPEPPKEDKH